MSQQPSWQQQGYQQQGSSGYYAQHGAAPAPSRQPPAAGGYQGPPQSGRLPPPGQGHPQGHPQGYAQHQQGHPQGYPQHPQAHPQGHPQGQPQGPPQGMHMQQKRPVPPGADQGQMKQQRQVPPAAYPTQSGQPPQQGGPPQHAGGAVPPSAAPSGPPQQQQPQGPSKETYVVFTCGQDRNEVTVKTLIGEYVEKGVNHGRKVYQRVNDKAMMDYVDVLLYYWDDREGENFEGWWFGNKLGGTQVWAHCKESAMTPPSTGWKIPWNGAVRQTLVVMNKEMQQKAEAEEKLNALTEEVKKADGEANAALREATAKFAQVGPPCALEAEQLLTPQVQAVLELGRKVAEAQKSAVGDTIKSFQLLGNRLKETHQNMTNEVTGMKSAKTKAETEAKNKAAEERDTKVLDELLPEAIEKTNTAEDMVEKTVITSEMITSCGDDTDMVKQALAETEQSAKLAQAAIGEARIFLNAKLASTRRFFDTVKDRASTELGKLQQQLQDAQNKLNPLKTVRSDWDQRCAAQRLVSEVEEKIVMAEVDVDRAEEMVTLLNSDTPTKDGLAQAQTALQIAENHINKAMNVYDTKKQGATGVPLEELKKLAPRGEAARSRIANLRASLKEAGERVTTEGYLDEAGQKVTAVTDALGKLEDIESRFQDGDDMSLEETLAKVKESEAAAAQAQTASSMARMFIQMKALEVKRFSSGPANDASKRLVDYQRQLELATKRLVELKGGVNRRKRLALVKEAEARVGKAESLVEKMKEAAAVFADDAKLMAMSADEIREASEKTSVCEKEANEALMEVRKFVTARQIEAKGKDASVEVSTELIKFQTRLSSAQSEVSKQRKLFTSVEQRLAVKRLIDEAEKKLSETEDKVAKAMAAVAGLEELTSESAEKGAKENDKAIKEAELSVQEASISIRTTTRFMESQSRTQGFAKDNITKLEPRVKECQDKIASANTLIKERSEKIFVRGILQEAESKVAECEAGLKKAVDVEAPFLEGDDSADKAASGSIADLEKALQAAQSLATSAKTFISMKRLAVKRLTDSASKASNEGLTKLQATVDDVTKKLSEMRTRSAELKRAALKREVKGKPAPKKAA